MSVRSNGDASGFGIFETDEQRRRYRRRRRRRIGDESKTPCVTVRGVKRTSLRQWTKLIANREGLDPEFVRVVIRAVCEEMFARILAGESVLLPVGVLAPHYAYGKWFNVFTRQWEKIDGRPSLRFTTTAKFRAKYKLAIEWKKKKGKINYKKLTEKYGK